jgi:hypothetical protein
MLMPMAHLEARICEVAGHIAAATCQYLRLVADFDAREGWRAWEPFHSWTIPVMRQAYG